MNFEDKRKDYTKSIQKLDLNNRISFFLVKIKKSRDWCPSALLSWFIQDELTVLSL